MLTELSVNTDKEILIELRDDLENYYNSINRRRPRKSADNQVISGICPHCGDNILNCMEECVDYLD